ncbi:MAG: glycosyltransferase family 2 protein [Pirellulaceae bacterium]|nr:glycosyltransferase family 2 protein [Pirellulaceae bacterium]
MTNLLPASNNPLLPATIPFTTPQVRPESADVRLERHLERLEQLTELLHLDAASEPATLSYPLPDGFLLSVVIPVYNERTTLPRILARLTAVPIRKELIIVDDGSTDGTRDLLQRLESATGVRIIYKPRNEGKGAALRTGFAAAEGHVIMVQDADLEYDPRDIPSLLEPIIAGRADVVYGSRYLNTSAGNSTWLHRAGNRLLTCVSNLTTGLRLTDMETCYKLFRRETLRQIEIRQPRFGFEPEITAKLARRRCRIEELPIRYQGRTWREGKKIGWRDALNALYCIARYAWVD